MELLFKFFLLSFFLFLNLHASSYNLTKDEIKKLIGRTIIIGFDGLTLNKSLKQEIKKYNLGGVILFEKYLSNNKLRNIKNPKQLKKLISDIQDYSNYKMLIAIDQEGGSVSRISHKNGFSYTPKASKVAQRGVNYAKEVYENLATELSNIGVNLNFAPVVDLNINHRNKVVVKSGRAYSDNSDEVIKYSKVFIEEMQKKGILTTLKHFPGHGSSLSDSHHGFVDITNTWQREELVPYESLIESDHAKIIMTAHVFNKNFDKNHPATLSHNINSFMLREKMKYRGLIISDDLQMHAISNHYTLKESVTLAINSGVNILLFGNHSDEKNIEVETIIDTIYKQIQKGEIKLSSIIKSNMRIDEVLY